MSGSLTAWFPERLTTQAGVSGVASSRAITASTPILLPCKDTQQQLLALPETAAASVASPSVSPVFCRMPTASLPSARVPKRWCGCQSRACRSPAGGNQHPAVTVASFPGSVEETFHFTDLLDLVGRDWFAVSGHGSLGHDDHIETGASGSLLRRQSERTSKRPAWRMQEQLTFKRSYVCQPPAQVFLPSVIWGHLWDEDPVSSAGLGRHQGQVPAAI